MQAAALSVPGQLCLAVWNRALSRSIMVSDSLLVTPSPAQSRVGASVQCKFTNQLKYNVVVGEINIGKYIYTYTYIFVVGEAVLILY